MRKQVTGWGNLSADVTGLRRKVKKLKEMIEYVSSQDKGVTELISDLNMKRRGRTITLLESRNEAICLTHSIVFRGSSPLDLLVHKDHVKVVRLNKAWTESYRCYDSDAVYTSCSGSSCTIACTRCCDVLSHSSVMDEYGNSYSLGTDDLPLNIEFGSFYSTETIDLISEKCFGMVPVTMDNILSL